MQFYYRCLYTNNKYMFVHVRSYATQYLIHAICFSEVLVPRQGSERSYICALLGIYLVFFYDFDI